MAWGRSGYGGDSTAVQDQLRNVLQICGSAHGFVAILADGTLVTWGRPNFGGDSTSVQHQLMFGKSVQTVLFLPFLANGKVVTWGDQNHGGDSSSVQGQFNCI